MTRVPVRPTYHSATRLRIRRLTAKNSIAMAWDRTRDLTYLAVCAINSASRVAGQFLWLGQPYFSCLSTPTPDPDVYCFSRFDRQKLLLLQTAN